jgi:flagellin FlaB
MWKRISRATQLVRTSASGAHGITGLETAIVLIAFVVVSSVFAFAALTTGLFSSDKSKETINAGLTETRSTLELKGGVVAKVTTGGGSPNGGTADVDRLIFQLANAAGGAVVNIAPGKTIYKYSDDAQTFLFDTNSEVTITALGGADNDKLVEPGEVYQVELLRMVPNLGTDLETGDTFIVEVIPSEGAVLHIERTTPVFLQSFNDLN